MVDNLNYFSDDEESEWLANIDPFMSVKMYLSWRTKERKSSPLGAKHHFLLLFCPPVRLHLHKREKGLLIPVYLANQTKKKAV